MLFPNIFWNNCGGICFDDILRKQIFKTCNERDYADAFIHSGDCLYE